MNGFATESLILCGTYAMCVSNYGVFGFLLICCGILTGFVRFLVNVKQNNEKLFKDNTKE